MPDPCRCGEPSVSLDQYDREQAGWRAIDKAMPSGVDCWACGGRLEPKGQLVRLVR